MKHLRDVLINESLKLLPDKEIINLIKNIHLKSDQEREIYKNAQENNKLETIELFLKSYTIQSEFRFLKDFFQTCVKNKDYHLIPLPAFSVDGEDFKGVVEKLSGPCYTKGLVKKFGVLTEQYGVTFLNNVFFLNQIYLNQKYNLDEVLNLDHSVPIKAKVVEPMKSCSLLLQKYRINRIMKLLVSNGANFLSDIQKMLENNPEQSSEILKNLPRKPKNWIELHDAISLGLLKQKKVNRKLNQELAFLDGQALLDYRIEVPSETYDLVDTSHELKHCVHGYDSSVIKKECQIINLVRFDKRFYTVELKYQGGKWSIGQFKGKNNDNTMETSAGYKYKTELLRLINEHQ